MDIIYEDILTEEICLHLRLLQWSVRSSIRMGWFNGVRWGVSLFQPAISITLHEYMKSWCIIQVIIFRLVLLYLPTKYTQKYMVWLIYYSFYFRRRQCLRNSTPVMISHFSELELRLETCTTYSFISIGRISNNASEKTRIPAA